MIKKFFEYKFQSLLTLLVLFFQPFNSMAEGTSVILPEKELNELNEAITSAGEYEKDFNSRVDSMKNYMKSLPVKADKRRLEALIGISKTYRPVNSDSAFFYAGEAMRVAEAAKDGSGRIRSRLAFIDALSTAGIFDEARLQYDSISSLPMTLDQRLELWKSGRLLYSYLRSYVEGNHRYYDVANSRYFAVDDSLLTYLDAKSKYRNFISCERLVSLGRFHEAKNSLLKLLESLKEGENLYGMTAFQLAEVFRSEGKQTEYAAYLAKASRSDIIGCVKEGVALPTLADWLYAQGELNDAFRYINFALEDARSGNARMRTVNIAAHVPHIDEAYRDKINSSRDELMIYVVIVTVLMALLLVLVFSLFRQIRKSKDIQKRLANTSRLQDNYIGTFIGLCSSYANRLDTLSRLVDRKISAGQSQDLLKLVKSGKFTESEDEDFYKVVDKAFLHIYPDFVESINRLLKSDEQIRTADEYSLTPELRIYAFVRLGVNESYKIAQILNYSPRTVYAYRNRMRNRALNRDKFDSEVMGNDGK